ncbi:MAG: hypothetical protein HQ575_03195 [Candidatus Omnitrophica bacterium]|nr:hypothetical protein [Candidatus Omnitrophota bacterium]
MREETWTCPTLDCEGWAYYCRDDDSCGHYCGNYELTDLGDNPQAVCSSGIEGHEYP